MKQKIALYIEPSAQDLTNTRPLGEWAENYPESYIRVTEFKDVEFEMSADYTERQIKSLREKSAQIEEKAAEQIKQIEELISSLAALEHMPV